MKERVKEKSKKSGLKEKKNEDHSLTVLHQFAYLCSL